MNGLQLDGIVNDCYVHESIVSILVTMIDAWQCTMIFREIIFPMLAELWRRERSHINDHDYVLNGATSRSIGDGTWGTPLTAYHRYYRLVTTIAGNCWHQRHFFKCASSLAVERAVEINTIRRPQNMQNILGSLFSRTRTDRTQILIN